MTGLHVAIIMDGNGRWARARGWPRWRGHVAGVRSVRAVVEAAPDLGVDTLTLYAFSADNWKRPASEVNALFRLLRNYCRREKADLVANGVRLTTIGRRDRFPDSVVRALDDTMEATAAGRRLHLRLALDYSARTAITDAVRSLVTFPPDDVTVDQLDRLMTGTTPAPDLLIRTSGERRLSDFLLWELAYTELWFTPVLWPDFRAHHLQAALDEFARRDRRFGGIPDPDVPVHLPAPDRLAG